MEKELVDGKLGEKAAYKVEFKDGKLCAEVLYDSPMFDAGMVLKLDGESVLTALKNFLSAKIPGQFDEMAFDAAIAYVKKKD